METRKLYYEDAHAVSCQSRVLSCAQTSKGWEITLDATVFYPEGGGQACDLGTLGNVRVLDVRERGEDIIHLCDGPLEVGETLEGKIDWQRRFDLMQQHTGEHILSGILHRRYGFHNVGFHMGSDMVTVDFDGVIPTEDLADIELEVNRAIWQNLAVKCWVPAPEERPGVVYRCKRALPWPVRIGQVPGFDSCACCGVHVKHTGEVGLVKIFSAIPCRGGTRMEMACGHRAYRLLNVAFDQNRQVSQAFSAKWQETGDAARQMNAALEAEKSRRVQLQRRIQGDICKNYVNYGNVLHFEADLDPVQVRELADGIAEVCGGTAAVFSGDDARGYSFALVTRTGDLRELGKAMTSALSGRGGGKPICQQGRVAAPEARIRAFFRDKF